jgi:NDP-sugar pyrophosphorylase family protein
MAFRLKYELTDYNSSTNMYRIRALIDFADVKAGDLGGLVRGLHSLADEGDCWVYYFASVWDDAQVRGDAKVMNRACALGQAVIKGNAMICDNAEVSGQAVVSDFAVVSDEACVTGNAIIAGHAKVRNSEIISRGLITDNGIPGTSVSQ